MPYLAVEKCATFVASVEEAVSGFKASYYALNAAYKGCIEKVGALEAAFEKAAWEKNKAQAAFERAALEEEFGRMPGLASALKVAHKGHQEALSAARKGHADKEAAFERLNVFVFETQERLQPLLEVKEEGY